MAILPLFLTNSITRQLVVPQCRMKWRSVSYATTVLPATTHYEDAGRQWRCKAAPQPGVPQEILEDSKFQRIQDEDPRFGPQVLLLLGFRHHELKKIEEFLEGSDFKFLKICLCTEEMIKGTLWEAINSTQEDLLRVQALEGIPRICFISGLTGKETISFVQTFSEIGIQSTVFAALVPKNAGKTLQDLVEEIMDDHNRLAGASTQ